MTVITHDHGSGRHQMEVRHADDATVTRLAVGRLYAAFARDDVAAALAVCAPGITHEIFEATPGSPLKGRFDGLAAMEAQLRAVNGDYAVLAVAIKHQAFDGCEAATERVTRAMHRATGRVIEVRGTEFLTVRDGLITRYDLYVHTVRAIATSGVEKAAAKVVPVSTDRSPCTDRHAG